MDTSSDIGSGFNEFGNINITSLNDFVSWSSWEQILGIFYYAAISIIGIFGKNCVLFDNSFILFDNSFILFYLHCFGRRPLKTADQPSKYSRLLLVVICMCHDLAKMLRYIYSCFNF